MFKLRPEKASKAVERDGLRAIPSRELLNECRRRGFELAPIGTFARMRRQLEDWVVFANASLSREQRCELEASLLAQELMTQ